MDKWGSFLHAHVVFVVSFSKLNIDYIKKHKFIAQTNLLKITLLHVYSREMIN